MPRPVRRGKTAFPVTLPAPVGGLNGRDGVTGMPSNYAYVLDNMFPNTNSVDSRGGYTAHVTGFTAGVQDLAVYEGMATTDLLACSAGKIFSAKTAGAVGAPLATGRINDNLQSCMFTNAGSMFLLGANGVDSPISYNGTTISNLVITGVTGGQNNLIGVFAFKGRVYWVHKQELGFYYLPVGQIQGAASYFDLGQVSQRGGKLQAMASFSHDGGNGPQDYAVFITNRGEYIVYEGYDPSNAATWSLVGRYFSAPPIGRKCAFNYNADLLIITTDGVMPFSAVRKDGGANAFADALTSNLGSLFTQYAPHSSQTGWMGCVYPRGHMLLINLYAGAAGFIQFAMNTTTNAWARFTGINAHCMVHYGDSVYVGTVGGAVCKFDDGRLDLGLPISVKCKQAYDYFGDPGDKHFHFARFYMACDATPTLSAEFNVDYSENEPVYAALPAEDANWALTSWDTDGAVNTHTFMHSIGKEGAAGSSWIQGALNGLTLKWYATQVMFSKTKGLI